MSYTDVNIHCKWCLLNDLYVFDKRRAKHPLAVTILLRWRQRGLWHGHIHIYVVDSETKFEFGQRGSVNRTSVCWRNCNKISGIKETQYRSTWQASTGPMLRCDSSESLKSRWCDYCVCVLKCVHVQGALSSGMHKDGTTQTLSLYQILNDTRLGFPLIQGNSERKCRTAPVRNSLRQRALSCRVL